MEQQQQQETPSPRGRGSGQRGRSRSRTRGGGRNYASRRFQQQQQQQQEQISTILQENQQRSENVKTQPRDPRIHEYIEEGKTLISKFFKGFEQEKRGNVEVQYDDHLPERIAEVYYDRINEHANSKYATLDNVDQRKRKCERMIKTFTAGITLATAIKLYKSSTELEKTSNFSLNLLQHAKITIPEKAAVIINQLGKTDLKDDNRIRILNQNMACKRTLVKALLRFSTINQIDEVTPNKLQNQLTVDHLYQSVFGPNSHKMIDNSLKSIQLLKELGREFFEHETSTAKAIRVNSVTRAQNARPAAEVEFSVRLPDFDFNTDVTKTHVRNYLNNPLFDTGNTRHFDWVDENVVVNIVCSLVLQIAKPDWIRNPNRRMNVLDNDFANTFISNATFLQVLNAAGIYNINNWIDDSDLNEYASMKLHEWSTSHVQNFSQILKMKEINFSEYGTDSQMVQIDDNDIDKISSFSGVNRYNIKKKPPAKVGLKISETGAIFGVMARFIKKFRMTSDFKVVHDSNNRNILREFLKSDIVH